MQKRVVKPLLSFCFIFEGEQIVDTVFCIFDKLIRAARMENRLGNSVPNWRNGKLS